MKGIVTLLLGFILCLWESTLGAVELYTPLEAWSGEYLPREYGAFYLKIRQQGFKKNARGQFITSSVFIHLQNVKDNKRYALSQSLGSDTTGMQKVWKIPQGNYQIQKMVLNDNSGLTRTWTSKGKPVIFVKQLFLSNVGQVTVSPGPGKALLALFVPAPDAFINNYGHEAFAGVIDAYTQKVQKKLGGSSMLAKAEDEYSTGDEARASISSQRQISMLIRVDLGLKQKYSKSIAMTLQSQDLDLRTCYMDQLDREVGLMGTVHFRFLINGQDGTMQNIKYAGGDLKNKKVIECLYYNLGKMQFALKSSAKGQVSFEFDAKEEMGRAMP